MEYKRQTHAVYYTRYHIVVCTKYRRKILKAGMGQYLRKSILGVMRRYPEIEIIEVNTDLDHMHVLISLAPKMSVSEAVNIIKSNTGKTMRRKFQWLDRVYWNTEGIWSIGYFVSTVGITEEVIQRYIRWQGKEDSGQAKLEF